MSGDRKIVDPAVWREALAEAGQPIDELMSAGDEFVDLDTAAWDAAEQWISDSHEGADDGLAAGAGAEPAAEPQPGARADRVNRVLQILLLCNVALIGVVYFLPGGGTAEEGLTAGADAPAVRGPDPFLEPPRRIGDVPGHRLWEAAVRAAGEGDHAGAVRLLEKYERETSMTDVERRLVYNQLAYYLVKDGRLEEAQDYERKSHQIMTRSYLPEDLLSSAHRAAEKGDLAEMRRAYARFLLQQRQIPPTLRKHIAEAYLELGESYRVEAERGQARAEQEEVERVREAQRRPK